MRQDSEKRVVPLPRSVRLSGEGVYVLRDGCPLEIGVPCEAEEARRLVERVCDGYWGIRSRVTMVEGGAEVAPEGYRLSCGAAGCRVAASGLAGVRNALRTLRQLAEAERGVLKASCWEVPAVEVEDAPALAFRGLHLCMFPEHELWETERRLRLAAYYKFNYVVIESWGVIRLESHPEFCWEERSVDKAEIRRLVELARELGVTLIPQFNIFGHATQARSGTGKHVLLDRHPEYASLFEPDGWSWCLSNPATRRYLEDIIGELHELFGRPPFFHVGCDEAYNAGSCRLCAQDFPRRLKEHLLHFRQFLAERGSRMMMWHDMLLCVEDPRWKGYIVCGHERDGLQDLYRELPRDIVICDWQYDYPERDGKAPDWPTVRFFHEQGMDVMPCPWLNRRGTLSLGRLADELRLRGLLMTTWHGHENSFRHTSMYVYGALAAWNPQATMPEAFVNEYLNRHVREIGHDMGLTRYEQFGTAHYQVSPDSCQGM